MQPVFVVDVAEMAVAAGKETGNAVQDTVGPEIYTFEELVQLIAGKIGSRARIFHLRPGLALFLSQLVGRAVHDVVLTQEEVQGIMEGLLVSEHKPTGRTRLSEWMNRHAHLLGMHSPQSCGDITSRICKWIEHLRGKREAGKIPFALLSVGFHPETNV